MTIPELGRLATVDPRIMWPHEAHHFTPWLLSNVDVLSDLLGMDLALEAAEHPVGDFSLDLIGSDLATGETVIVENQLEVSDHNHLGQIITYAAGTDPTTIVWVTTGFRPEHRAAIDWLNTRTDEITRVFGVVIKVVKIGDSEPAPAFELVAQPNDWEKKVRKAAGTGSESDRTRAYREFWERALGRMRVEHPAWTRAKTSSQSFCDTGIGTSGVVISMAWTGPGLVAQIYFNHSDADVNQANYDAVFEHREAFEAALGETAAWNPMPGRKGARITLLSPFADVMDDTQWDAAIDWLIEKQKRLRDAFSAVEGALP